MKRLFTTLLVVISALGLFSCNKAEQYGDFYIRDSIEWISSLNKDNVKKVVVEYGVIGTMPGTRIKGIYEGCEVEDIEYNLKFLNESKGELETYMIAGGSYQKLTFITENETYSMRIENSYVMREDGMPIKLTTSLRPTILSNFDNQLGRMQFHVNYDYGNIVPNKATRLIDDCLIPKEIIENSYFTYIGGELLDVKYLGEITIKETSPSTLDLSNALIKEVAVYQGYTIEFEMVENPGGGKSLCRTNGAPSVGKYLTRNVINEDGSYSDLDSFPVGAKIYGVTQAHIKDDPMSCFYSFLPHRIGNPSLA